MQTGYTIHTNGNTTLEAGAVTSSLSASNRIARGESVEITLRDIDLQLIVGGGETVVIDDTQAINRVEINSGGTLTVDGTLRADELDNQGTLNVNGTLTVTESVGVELEDIRQYREYAGNATLTETIDGTQRFSETIDTAALDSLVVGIEPNSDLKNRGIPGVWGVVESVTDARNRQFSTNAITLSVGVLAPYSDYNSVGDVTNDLRID